jgi:phosphoglycerol transferase MdoB-like AlkP superfamily enzyme
MKLLKLKEFWTVVVDFVVSVVLFFVGKYAAPSVFEDIKFVIVALQPIVGLLIAVFATDRLEGLMVRVLARPTAIYNNCCKDDE